MAALHSSGPEAAPARDMTLIPLESLVPTDTRLLTATVSEAFELPYNLSGQEFGREFPAKEFQGRETATKDNSGPKDMGQGSGQMQGQPQNMMQPTASTKQQPGSFNYQRNMYGGAQQPMMGNFFPQQSPQNPMPQQPAYPMEAPDHQLQGFLRQQAGLSGPQMPSGYAGMSPQFNGWMDPAQPAPAFGSSAQPSNQNPGKHTQEGNVGSDPDNDDYQARALKRPRLVWTLQLHQRFVDAVEQLGLKNAVPKTIMQLMNVDGLTRENVASHLQKYRLQLRKDGGKGDDMDKMVDEEPHKELEPEQPRLTISEAFK